MKSVSNSFLIAQENKVNFPINRVYIKRRYWDTVTNAYIWESSWTEIDRNEIYRIDSIVHQLDTQTMNEFKVSNVSIHFRNSDNLWQEWNTINGKFMADGISAFGYEPYLTKFQIKTGFQNVGGHDARLGETGSEGTEELITVFTGLASDYQFDTKSQLCKITVEGLERLLLNGDAERVCNTVTLETIGTGDGTTKEFYTAYSGVGSITTVTVNSVTMTKGIDYDVSQLDDIDESAQITLSQSPANGHLIKCSYKHWKKNQLLETLIGNLVDESGIVSKSIASATLGSIQNNITMSSKADFDAGTNTNIDTSTKKGKILIDFSGINSLLWNDFESGTLIENGWTASGGNWDVGNGYMRAYNTGIGQYVYKLFASPATYGVWKIDWAHDNTNSQGRFRFIFLANANDKDYAQGYAIQWGGNYGQFIDPWLKLIRLDSSGIPIVLGEDKGFISADNDLGFHTFVIIRDKLGILKVYVDGNLKITSTPDMTYVSGDRALCVSRNGIVSPIYYHLFDNIYIPKTLTAIHQSQTIFVGYGLTAWGNLTIDYILSSFDTISILTRSGYDPGGGIVWSSWTPLTETGGIQSPTNSGYDPYGQFRENNNIQIKITITSLGFNEFEKDEELSEISFYTVQFTSNQVFVAMGNFSGMTCYSAIQELAKFSDYEWGLNDDETFFFRARDVSSTPDLTLNQDTNLGDVQLLEYGYGNVYGIVRAEFGNFVAEVSSIEDSRTSALEIYGRTIFSISSSILINKDTNVADGIAAAYLAKVSLKRRRLSIETKYCPQIELSDVVSVTFKRNPFSLATQFIDGLICKILGNRHDPEGKTSQFELEEILI